MLLSSLVVSTKEKIDVHNLSNMNKMFSIDIDPSPVRLALSPGKSTSYLAYTTSILKGDVTVYDLKSGTKQVTISAHNTPVIQMKFSPKGNLLATASSNVNLNLLLLGVNNKDFQYSEWDESSLLEARNCQDGNLFPIIRSIFQLPRANFSPWHSSHFLSKPERVRKHRSQT